MKYINTFKTYASYEEKLNGGGVDISLPNVSYCKDVKDVHYTPYNLVRFYVGNITGTTQQTVKIYTDFNTSVDVEVSKGNKWYTYVLPKDKGLYSIESGYYDYDNDEWVNGIVTKAVVKANISYYYYDYNDTSNGIIPWGITEVSFKGSDTSKVTDMKCMFLNCSGLTYLDVSSFDTSNVTDMNGMFDYCYNLTSLDLSSFNTSNVTNMGHMFSVCSGLTSLDLRNFNTSNVTDMSNMFFGCDSLTSLILSNFNTSNVTNMFYMFNGCSNLVELDLSGWVIGDATDTRSMFGRCSKLKTIRMVGCSEATRTKIQNQLTADGITGFTIVTE